MKKELVFSFFLGEKKLATFRERERKKERKREHLTECSRAISTRVNVEGQLGIFIAQNVKLNYLRRNNIGRWRWRG